MIAILKSNKSSERLGVVSKLLTDITPLEQFDYFRVELANYRHQITTGQARFQRGRSFIERVARIPSDIKDCFRDK